MKLLKSITAGAGIVLTMFWTAASFAQNDLAANNRLQMQRKIEIIENVLDTVRQQVIASAAPSAKRNADSESPNIFYLRTGERDRTEGIYLNGYGVIFEVYLPTFSEQRSYSILFRKTSPLASAFTMTESSDSSTASHATTQKVSAQSGMEPTTTALGTLSKLIESYDKQLQSQTRDAALRDLFSQLKSAGLFSNFKFIAENSQESDAVSIASEESRLHQQRKQFQDSLIRAIADYGSTLPGLPLNDQITLFLKAPVAQEGSLFSPVMRTSKIIRFSVKDLQDYKVGKINYEELQKRVSIEEN